VSLPGNFADHHRRANPLVVETLIAVSLASSAVFEMQFAAGSGEGFRDSEGLGLLLIVTPRTTIRVGLTYETTLNSPGFR